MFDPGRVYGLTALALGKAVKLAKAVPVGTLFDFVCVTIVQGTFERIL